MAWPGVGREEGGRGERRPPREGVRVREGMEGGQSFSSRSRSRLLLGDRDTRTSQLYSC